MKRRDLVTGAAALAAYAALGEARRRGGVASSGGGNSLTNGVAFTVTGSGFGSKSGSAPTIYDDISGSGLLSLWSWRWHIANDTWGEAYHAPGDSAPDSTLWGQTGANLVSPATPFRTKYIAAACATSNGTGYNAGDIMFGHTDSGLTPPFYVVCSWYEAISPNWVFNTPYSGSGETAPGDNNFKWVVYTTSLTGGYGSKYWYLENQNSRFTSVTDIPKQDINDDGSALVGRGTASPGYAIPGPAMPNKYYNTANNWVKKELAMYMTSATTGWIKVWWSVPNAANPGHSQARWNGYSWDNTVGSGKTDPYPGTGRTFWLGGFRRDFPQTQNRQYFSDVYLDIQSSGPGRFLLADSSSLSTATCIEWQPYTSWSSTSVTLTCQKGNLQTGTVYLHYVDELNGTQYLGTRTMN